MTEKIYNANHVLGYNNVLLESVILEDMLHDNCVTIILTNKDDIENPTIIEIDTCKSADSFIKIAKHARNTLYASCYCGA